MKGVLKLSFAYLRYYKKQTFSLFLGVLLSAALLSGVGSLLYSGSMGIGIITSRVMPRRHSAFWKKRTETDMK